MEPSRFLTECHSRKLMSVKQDFVTFKGRFFFEANSPSNFFSVRLNEITKENMPKEKFDEMSVHGALLCPDKMIYVKEVEGD